MSDVAKKLRLTSHETSENCRCKLLQCFEPVSAEERKVILRTFNSLLSHDEQNSYICDLISTHPIARRRPRKNAEDANFHDKSYRYRVRVLRKAVSKISFCYKAFIAIHGITKRKLEILQKSLKSTAGPPGDAKGRHYKKSNKLLDTVIAKVCAHIGFFKSRKSHYTLHKTQKLYLSEDLNILTMHKLHKKNIPNFHCRMKATETYLTQSLIYHLETRYNDDNKYSYTV
ncbi:hypothetical protein RN001_008081 [Aquatica leii]|uniref:Uncharacterized protein n=1 Tax=Aquatica leii TaxID=1421715 RepID=A0AAN7Q4U8_9COLE|nr:hypothetical protein RN001_008081 [Aquatica leii]